MSLVDAYLKKPHLVTSLVLLAAVVGLVGYRRMPVNLFPDSEYPQVAVVTVYPGAAAPDVETEVSRTIEKELATIDQVRRVTSVSKDEVSSVLVEFEYPKGLEAAATDAANGLKKIEARLPVGIRPPMIFKVSSATPAVLTLALRPKEGAPLDLSMVRQLADNQIKERLLQLPEVSNVEVFGAQQPVVQVDLDRDRLQAYGLTPGDVRERLVAFNANQPIGLLITSSSQVLLKRTGEFEQIDDVGRITVAHRSGGDVLLGDVSTIRRAVLEPQSAYHGGGRPAIAINVQRATTGNALRAIADVMAVLPELEASYPTVAFSIPDTQGDLIELAVGNMVDALRDAVIMTVLVIFLFLADLRGMTLAAISIPFTYLLTFAVMWLVGYELNMVTLTGVIVAVGMLLDDAIVVLENIERHYHEGGASVHAAVVGGTEEVMLAIFSGTYATVMVLVPIVFIGGFVQTVLRPLAVTLIVALAASYIVSVTVIPLLAPVLLRRGTGTGRNRFERLVFRFDEWVVEPIRDFYVRLTAYALGHRALFVVAGVVLFVVSARQLTLIGRDLMPPMDAGIVKINFETDANTSLERTERALTADGGDHPVATRRRLRVGGHRIRTGGDLVRTGPPAAAGTGHGPSRGSVSQGCVDLGDRRGAAGPVPDHSGAEERGRVRFRRDAALDHPRVGGRDDLGTGPRRAGSDRPGRRATPARSVARRDVDRPLLDAGLDGGQIPRRPGEARLYRISPAAVAAQLAGAVRGVPGSLFRVPNQDGLAMWVQLPAASAGAPINWRPTRWRHRRAPCRSPRSAR